MDDREQPLPSWVTELKDALECPVCLKTCLDPPIHQCENGHYFCGDCHEPLQNEGKGCPVCRGQLIKARSLAVEKMLEKLPKIKCRYEDCQFKRADIDAVHQHETDCLFRLVECSVCEKGIPLSRISDHLVLTHRKHPNTMENFGIEKKGFIPQESGLNKAQSPLKCKDLTFFINRNDYNDDLMMFWVSFCGTKKEAEQYEYTIKIMSSAEKKAGRTQYLFTGSRRCVSCHVSHKDMKKTLEALFVSKELMRKAAEEHDEKMLEWKLIVQQL